MVHVVEVMQLFQPRAAQGQGAIGPLFAPQRPPAPKTPSNDACLALLERQVYTPPILCKKCHVICSGHPCNFDKVAPQ
jgi:hypothetical protein